MTIRSVSLLAAIALAGLASSALAQDPPALPPMPAQDAQGSSAGQVPNMGYTYDQRAAWLEQCRAAYSGSQGVSSTEGAVIGGVVGAVAGGAAGAAIDDGDTDGTLIGAGVGAVAGAAIGSAVAADSSDAGYDQCEDYLARYEQGYSGYAQGPAPEGYENIPGVTWVRIPLGKNCCCPPQPRISRVIEEVLPQEYVPAPAPPPRPRPSKIERIAPAPGKTVPIQQIRARRRAKRGR